MGHRVKVYAAAMEVNGCFEVFPVSETAGHLLNRLDGRVQSLTDRISDSMFQVGQNVGQIFAEHAGYLLYRFQRGPYSPSIPGVKVLFQPSL